MIDNPVNLGPAAMKNTQGSGGVGALDEDSGRIFKDTEDSEAEKKLGMILFPISTE